MSSKRAIRRDQTEESKKLKIAKKIPVANNSYFYECNHKSKNLDRKRALMRFVAIIDRENSQK